MGPSGAPALAAAAVITTIMDAAKSCDPGANKYYGWLASAIARSGVATQDPVCELQKRVAGMQSQISRIQNQLNSVEHTMIQGFAELKIDIAQLASEEAGRAIMPLNCKNHYPL